MFLIYFMEEVMFSSNSKEIATNGMSVVPMLQEAMPHLKGSSKQNVIEYCLEMRKQKIQELVKNIEVDGKVTRKSKALRKELIEIDSSLSNIKLFAENFERSTKSFFRIKSSAEKKVLKNMETMLMKFAEDEVKAQDANPLSKVVLDSQKGRIRDAGHKKRWAGYAAATNLSAGLLLGATGVAFGGIPAMSSAAMLKFMKETVGPVTKRFGSSAISDMAKLGMAKELSIKILQTFSAVAGIFAVAAIGCLIAREVYKSQERNTKREASLTAAVAACSKSLGIQVNQGQKSM